MSCDIIILGAGIAGLTSAAYLNLMDKRIHKIKRELSNNSENITIIFQNSIF